MQKLSESKDFLENAVVSSKHLQKHATYQTKGLLTVFDNVDSKVLCKLIVVTPMIEMYS